MKKLSALLMLFALALTLLAGCGSSTADAPAEDVPLTDSDFIVNLGKGLEARWAIADSEKYSDEALSKMSMSEYQNYCTMVVDAELNEMGSLEDYEFEDANLKELAETYMKGLELQKEGIQYQGTDQYTQQQQTWNLGYNYRAVCMTDLYNEYGLTVSEKYQKDLNDFVSYSATAAKEIAIQEYADELPNVLEYTKDEGRSDEWTSYYTAIVENTTDYEIKSLQIDIDYLDASGVVIYQTSDYLQNIQPGSKVQSTALYENDRGDFTSMQYHITAYTE